MLAPLPSSEKVVDVEVPKEEPVVAAPLKDPEVVTQPTEVV